MYPLAGYSFTTVFLDAFVMRGWFFVDTLTLSFGTDSKEHDMGKPILCLDFDGVIHSYSSGWKGADVIPDPPVAGAFNFIRDADRTFDVHVFSSRSHQPGGIDAMRAWFVEWDKSATQEYRGCITEYISFPDHKPSAMVSIDDRALMFDGTWPLVEELRRFQPWNKRVVGASGDHPQGQHNSDDQGGLRMAIGVDNGIVRVDFGKPVAWLGLDKATALALSDNLRRHAETLAVH
jgi:hypothetical protein